MMQATCNDEKMFLCSHYNVPRIKIVTHFIINKIQATCNNEIIEKEINPKLSLVSSEADSKRFVVKWIGWQWLTSVAKDRLTPIRYSTTGDNFG